MTKQQQEIMARAGEVLAETGWDPETEMTVNGGSKLHPVELARYKTAVTKLLLEFPDIKQRQIETLVGQYMKAAREEVAA